jgi:metal transporter CNNM
MDYVIVAVLVLLSGIFSGLTLGMFSLSLAALERKIRLGDKKAKRVYSVRKKGNLLLCTLLLGNVAVNSAIAIFLGSIASGVIAGFIATGLIVLFGEIVPQAFFSRFALSLGARTVWLVKVFMVLLYPVAKPIAFGLDKILGEELPTVWDKREIKEIIKYHEDSPDSEIDGDEERITLGALSFSDQIVKNILTPRNVVFYLNSNDIIDNTLLSQIKSKGFTRIPVFHEDEPSGIGILMAKDLLAINETGKKTVWELSRKEDIIKTNENEKLDRLLNRFISRKMHLAFVYNDKDEFSGIVTLEDVIEEILRTEIVDELDKIDDMRKLAKQK